MLIFVAIALAAFLVVTGAFIFGHAHDGDLGHGGDASDTISLFSTRVVGTLCMGFGAAGALARNEGASYPMASLIGVGAGVVLAALMYGMLRLIVGEQSSSLIETRSLVGATGTVSVPIDAGALGEVAVSFGGQYQNYPAKARGGVAIAKGRTVRVVEVIGSQLTVEETV